MKISVVTVSFNAARTIEATIQSVAKQSVRPEYIVIDGASNDGTVALIEANEHCIANWVSEADSGLYDAMNKGVQLATGDYVGFLNADDSFARRDAVSLISAAATSSGADILAGDVVIVDGNKKIIRFYGAGSFATWQLRFGQMPPHPGIYVRRQLLLEHPFRTDIRIGADFDQVLRLRWKRGASLAKLSATLVEMHSGGISTSGFAATVQINRERERILKDHGISSHRALLWSRYVLKVLQYFTRPTDYPARETAL